MHLSVWLSINTEAWDTFWIRPINLDRVPGYSELDEEDVVLDEVSEVLLESLLVSLELLLSFLVSGFVEGVDEDFCLP